MSAKTAAGLVAYAKAQIGRPYWYGTYGQIATSALLKAKRAQYPDYYDQKKYKIKFTSQYGQRCHDCAGLIKGYLFSETPTSVPVFNAKYDWGANTMLKSHCTEKGKIDTIPELPGVLVFMDKHVGVYIGGGYVVEAKGHDSGVVKTALKGRGWTHWGKLAPIDYSEKVQAPDTTPTNPTPTPTKTPKAGQAVNLRGVNLYAAASASIPVRQITGTYYLYDGKLTNGRYRITNNASNAGKKPMVLYVTGWIDKGAV